MSYTTSSVRRSSLAYLIYFAASQAAFDRGIFILFLLSKGFDKNEAGILQFVLFGASFLSEIPMGILGDRFGRKRTVVTGLLAFVTYCFGVISLNGFLAFFLLYALYGIALSLISGSDKALIYDELARHKAEGTFLKLESRARMVGSVVLCAAITVGGYLQLISWDAVYLAYAGAFVISGIAFMFIPSSRSQKEHDTEHLHENTTGEAIRFFVSGNGRTLLPFFLFLGIINFVFTPYYIFSQALFSELGMSISHVAIVFSVAELAHALGYGLSNRIQNRWGNRRPFLLLPFLFSALLLGNAAGSALASVVVFMCSCVLIASVEPIYTNYINQRFHKRIRATANSFDAFVQSLFTSAGFLIYGYLTDLFATQVIVTMSAAIPLVAVVFALWHFRSAKQTPPVHTTRLDN